MIYLGKLKEETADALILEDCAWIPDTSRWSEFLQGKKPNEMEPYSEDVIVYKGASLNSAPDVLLPSSLRKLFDGISQHGSRHLGVVFF